jgi:hypothetical protein
MFAADAELESGRGGAAALGAISISSPTPSMVERDERIALEDALAFYIGVRKIAGIVARDAERRLRQVVGAEAEELRRLGDLARRSAARGSSIIVPTMIGIFTPFRRTRPSRSIDHF